MKSYGQYCALARSLDVVGDRWCLLIVRELLEGPCRYGELLDGLPGIATNLLVERLRALEESDVVTRQDDGRYTLTTWGEGLHDVVYALGRWAGPLMQRPRGDEHFRSHWMRHMVVVVFDGVDQRRGDLTVAVDIGDEPMTLVSAAGEVRVERGEPAAADLRLSGEPDTVVGLIAGRIDAAAATAAGVRVVGDVRKLARLRPRRPVTPRHGTTFNL
ncbi:MAG: winged helix-turn-helix transcriptional regulator [Candidatus Dormibacteria bacterium]